MMSCAQKNAQKSYARNVLWVDELWFAARHSNLRGSCLSLVRLPNNTEKVQCPQFTVSRTDFIIIHWKCKVHCPVHHRPLNGHNRVFLPNWMEQQTYAMNLVWSCWLICCKANAGKLSTLPSSGPASSCMRSLLTLSFTGTLKVISASETVCNLHEKFENAWSIIGIFARWVFWTWCGCQAAPALTIDHRRPFRHLQDMVIVQSHSWLGRRPFDTKVDLQVLWEQLFRR